MFARNEKSPQILSPVEAFTKDYPFDSILIGGGINKDIQIDGASEIMLISTNAESLTVSLLKHCHVHHGFDNNLEKGVPYAAISLGINDSSLIYQKEGILRDGQEKEVLDKSQKAIDAVLHFANLPLYSRQKYEKKVNFKIKLDLLVRILMDQL